MPWRNRTGVSPSSTSGLAAVATGAWNVVVEASFITQRLDRIEPGRAPGRIQGCEQRERERHHDHGGRFLDIHIRRQARQEIERRTEQGGTVEPGQEL